MQSQILDPRVRAAVAQVSRAEFLGASQLPFVDEDRPLDIGYGQTTSQPSLIAWTLEQLHLRPTARVLEVGTGCGYQTALLAELCAEVYSIDIVEPLVKRATKTLNRLGYTNVHVRCSDGYLGWPEAAPFDAIVVSAGASAVPEPLLEQLAPGGRLIIPVGVANAMSLWLLRKAADGTITEQEILDVRFVPLTGPRAEADRSRTES
jgi:protein-L-isoaspartate(D-aspartate) O-methyltransferase